MWVMREAAPLYLLYLSNKIRGGLCSSLLIVSVITYCVHACFSANRLNAMIKST